jgi:hypothetical protein
MKKVVLLLLAGVIAALFSTLGKSVIKKINERQNSNSVMEMAQEISDEMNVGLPSQTDELMRMDTTSVGPGKQFNFFYTFVTDITGSMSPEQFAAKTRPQLTQSYRTNSKLADFRKNGVAVRFCYRDMNGRVFADIVIKPSDL